MRIDRAFVNTAETVFLNPEVSYTFRRILLGANARTSKGTSELMIAVDKNTARSFHQIDGYDGGILKPIQDFLISKENMIQDALHAANSQIEIDDLSEELSRELVSELSGRVKPKMLECYNRTRKVIDLVIEHTVAMSSELSSSRNRLVPMLFLPLDQYTLGSNTIEQQKRVDFKLPAKPTLGSVSSREQYVMIQQYFIQRSRALTAELEKNFYPIYLDLLWNNRYSRKGRNLFELNK